MESIIQQLIDIYYTNESWHNDKLDTVEAEKYHRKLFEQGNIITYLEDGRVLGYLEFWRVNFEQFGRLVCNAPFSGFMENINDGKICYVANMWISPEHRRGKVFKEISHEYYRRNKHCDYYVGQALRKPTQPVKVFKRAELKSKLFNDEGEE